MNTIKTRYYKSPVGELILGSFNDQLCLCDWKFRRMRTSIDKRIQKQLDATYKTDDCPIIEETIQQLEAYFSQAITNFDLPLLLVGTDFQKQVWASLLEIPYGKTTSYLELSRQLNNEKAIRAVASANGANAISIIVPCHRIIGSDGSLVGYAGGISVKKRLLKLEASYVQLELF